jgi:HSP20 family protein
MHKRRKEILNEPRAIEEQTEQAFEDAFHTMWNLKKQRLKPLAYLNEMDDPINITIDLPLVKKNDIQLNLIGNMLEINATLQRCVRFKHWGAYHKQCEFKSLYKAIQLSKNLNTDEIKAKFEKGILTITIPKKITKYKIKIE